MSLVDEDVLRQPPIVIYNDKFRSSSLRFMRIGLAVHCYGTYGAVKLLYIASTAGALEPISIVPPKPVIFC